MSRQYKRQYQLTLTSESGDSVTFDGLRIQFEITKSLQSHPNLAMITIFNPDIEMTSIASQKFSKVVLNLGYEGDLRLAFTGEIRNAFNNKFGVDRKLVLYAGDGERGWQNATINRTYSENVELKSIIQDIANTFVGVAAGSIQDLPESTNKISGQTLSGASRDILDEYAKEFNFSWSIQDGELTIVSDDSALDGDEYILLNYNTGLVGEPTITEIGADVTTLLNPRLLPNRAFRIESDSANVQIGNLFFEEAKNVTANGLYKVVEVKFTGDSQQGQWLSTAKGSTING